jgi:hypothetical protein
MRDTMLSYFAGEKHGAIALMAAAVAALAAAAALFPARHGLRSLAITVACFGVLFAAIGVGLWLRTGPQVDRLTAQLGGDAATYFAEETARMAKVQRAFVVIELVELAVIAVASIAAIAWKSRPVLSGVALGFLINAAFLLAFDIVAERRGAVYLSALEAQAPRPLP